MRLISFCFLHAEQNSLSGQQHLSTLILSEKHFSQVNILGYDDCSKMQDAGLVERVVKMVQ